MTKRLSRPICEFPLIINPCLDILQEVKGCDWGRIITQNMDWEIKEVFSFVDSCYSLNAI
jgi:hypothetical protein